MSFGASISRDSERLSTSLLRKSGALNPLLGSLGSHPGGAGKTRNDPVPGLFRARNHIGESSASMLRTLDRHTR